MRLHRDLLRGWWAHSGRRRQLVKKNHRGNNQALGVGSSTCPTRGSHEWMAFGDDGGLRLGAGARLVVRHTGSARSRCLRGADATISSHFCHRRRAHRLWRVRHLPSFVTPGLIMYLHCGPQRPAGCPITGDSVNETRTRPWRSRRSSRGSRCCMPVGCYRSSATPLTAMVALPVSAVVVVVLVIVVVVGYVLDRSG